MAESTDVPDIDGNRAKVATDDVTINGEAVRVQRVKQGYGAEGSFSDMTEKPATEAKQIEATGSAGTTPPALASGASGVLGWTRKIVDTLAGILSVKFDPTSPAVDAASNKLIVGNTREKFRDGFTSADATKWVYPSETGTQYARSRFDGNVAGESYLVVSLSALTPGGDDWQLVSVPSFKVPYELEFGLSLSQRIQGQEIAVEMVGVDEAGVVVAGTLPAPVAISGSISVTSNSWSVNTTGAHGLRVGQVVALTGADDTRLNVGPVTVTTVNGPAETSTGFTFTSTLANGTYTPGGAPVVHVVNLTQASRFQAGFRWAGATAGNCDVTSTNNDAMPRVHNLNPGNTQDAPILPNEGGINYASLNYCQAFRSKGSWHLDHSSKRLLYRARDTDTTTTDRTTHLRRMPLPIHDFDYKIRIRARNLPNLSVPAGNIVSISKVGSTTWNVNCPGHGRTSGSFVVLYGVRDAAGFPNLTTPTQILSVVDADNFTITSTTGTATSYGGFVMGVNGGQVPAIENRQVQTYQKTADGLRLLLVANTNWTETVGNTVTLFGLVDSTSTVISSLHGRYRVAFQSTTSIELQPIDGQDLSAVPTVGTNAGGTLIRNTDLRVNATRVYDRTRMEIDNSKAGHSAEADPVAIVGTVPVSGTITANIGTGSLAAGTNAIGDFGVQYRANATGAGTDHHVVAAASTNSSIVKASAGRLIGCNLANTTAAWQYVKLHNIATAPTAGSGVVKTIGIPPNGRANFTFEGGIGFSTGIGRTIVTGAADADATATTANAVVGDLIFA